MEPRSTTRYSAEANFVERPIAKTIAAMVADFANCMENSNKERGSARSRYGTPCQENDYAKMLRRLRPRASAPTTSSDRLAGSGTGVRTTACVPKKLGLVAAAAITPESLTPNWSTLLLVLIVRLGSIKLFNGYAIPFMKTIGTEPLVPACSIFPTASPSSLTPQMALLVMLLVPEVNAVVVTVSM